MRSEGGDSVAASIEDKRQLAAALRSARRVMPRIDARTVSHLGLWLTVTGTGLRLRAESEELLLEQQLPAATEGEGECVIAPAKLEAVVRHLDQGPVTLRLGSEALGVSSNRFHGALPLLDASQYHRPTDLAAETSSVVVSAAGVISGLQHVAFAQSTGEPSHMGASDVELRFTESEVRFLATDVVRVAIAEVDADLVYRAQAPRSSQTYHVPWSALIAGVPHLPRRGDLSIRTDGVMVELSGSGSAIRMRIGSGPFPSYQPMIERDQPNQVEMRTSDLVAALQRTGVIAAGHPNKVEVSIGDGKVTLSTLGSQIGAASEEVEAVTQSVTCKLAMPYDQLLAMAENLAGPTTVLVFSEVDKPCLVFSPDRPGFRYHVEPFVDRSR